LSPSVVICPPEGIARFSIQSQPSNTTSKSLTDVATSAEAISPNYPHLTRRIVTTIASHSFGDARTALSLLELVLFSPPTTPESALLESLRRSVSTTYDRTGDSHYDLISALHKSVRGSQPGAALYWLARMLEAGEDPVYIARRMTVCASEDIGMADRDALPLVSTLVLSRVTYILTAE
jgi:putative ATPase